MDSFTELALEYWKLLRLAERLVSSTEGPSNTRITAQLNYYKSRLERLVAENNIQLIDETGNTFEVNLPFIAVNVDELEGAAVIAQTLEPAVIQSGAVLKMGKVVLAPQQNVRS